MVRVLLAVVKVSVVPEGFSDGQGRLTRAPVRVGGSY